MDRRKINNVVFWFRMKTYVDLNVVFDFKSLKLKFDSEKKFKSPKISMIFSLLSAISHEHWV